MVDEWNVHWPLIKQRTRSILHRIEPVVAFIRGQVEKRYARCRFTRSVAPISYSIGTPGSERSKTAPATFRARAMITSTLFWFRWRRSANPVRPPVLSKWLHSTIVYLLLLLPFHSLVEGYVTRTVIETVTLEQEPKRACDKHDT